MTPTAIIRAARAAIRASANPVATWERYAADIAAAMPGDDADDTAWERYDAASEAMDRIGARIGAI